MGATLKKSLVRDDRRVIIAIDLSEQSLSHITNDRLRLEISREVHILPARGSECHLLT